jgi:predicted SprT family Zn-dependent metalloprotease
MRIKTFREFIKDVEYNYPCKECKDNIDTRTDTYFIKQNEYICLSCDREDKLKKILN